jgi:demethylspheroidene O-methyltransferase
VAVAAPKLELALFDLPAVAERARPILDLAGLERVQTHGGSFFDDPLPRDFDLVTLVRILHDHDDEPVRKLLRNIHTALPPGGTLLIAEPMASDKPSSVGDVYFGFYLLAMGQGRARTPAEITSLLTSAGFEKVKHIRTPLPLAAQIITSKKPVQPG